MNAAFKHIKTYRNDAGVPCIKPGIYYSVNITPELYVRLLQVTRKHDIDMAIEVLAEVSKFKEMYDVD